MRPDTRCVSFVFDKDDANASKENRLSEAEATMTRRRLQDRFDKECPCSLPKSRSRTALAVVATRWRNNFNLSSLSASSVQTGKVLRSGAIAGAQKITRTFSNVCISLDSFSQRLRRSTRRRYRLPNESPITPTTPGTQARRVLGRTPTKLYSPFVIETPRQKGVSNGFVAKKSRGISTGGSKELGSVYSPQRKFASDIASARDGVADFDRTAANIVRRSLRH